MRGTKADRPELKRMIAELQAGDNVVIADLSRVSRSTKDLLMIVDMIKANGATIKSLKDNCLDDITSNPYNEFLLIVKVGMSQLERDLISTRTKEGLIVAKVRGRSGGRPSKRSEKAEIVQTLYKEGYKIVDIGKVTSLSRTTIYRILNK